MLIFFQLTAAQLIIISFSVSHMTKEIDWICNRTEVFQAHLRASASQQIQRSQICCLGDCSFVRSWLAYSMQRQRPPWAEKPPEKSSIVTTSVKQCSRHRLHASRALTYSLHLSCPAPAASKSDGKVVWQNVSSAKLVIRFKKNEESSLKHVFPTL